MIAKKTGIRKVARKRVGAVRRRYKKSTKLATVGQVKRMISKRMENKLAGQVLTVPTTPFINTPGVFLPLLPSIAQGDTDNQREGNKVFPRRLRVAITVAYLRSPSTPIQSNSILYRILAVSDKKFNHIPIALNQTDASHLLDSGTGEHAYLARIEDYLAPVNSECYKVHKDIRGKISFGTDEVNMYNTYTHVFTINCPKVLSYNDNQTFPTNFAPMLAVGYSFADGTIPTDQFNPMNVTLQTTLYYEDA